MEESIHLRNRGADGRVHFTGRVLLEESILSSAISSTPNGRVQFVMEKKNSVLNALDVKIGKNVNKTGNFLIEWP
jgi:hypothetical protein